MSNASQKLKLKILDLRPAQMALGFFDVDTKIRKLERFKKNELEKYLDDRPVPVVRYSPTAHYVIDHHHLVRALWETGHENADCELVADLSHLEEAAFWKFMHDKRWTYLKDAFGNEHGQVHLPSSIRSMGDDLFRSVAFAAREAGGFEKTKIPFAEFYWGEYFRKEMGDAAYALEFEKLVKQALVLCHSEKVLGLPGAKQAQRI